MKLEFSAGGIVYKINNLGTIEILICQHGLHHGWVFPKGHIGDTIKNESRQEAAIREVKEETGINGKIISALAPIYYFYQIDKIKRKKTVYYFLMEYMDGNISIHDNEMENVEWLPIEKIEKRLTYESDKNSWEQAKQLLGEVVPSGD